MSYSVNKQQAVVQFGTAAEVDLASTGVAGISWIVMSRINVRRLVAMVSTVLSSTGNAVVTYRYRPTFGSASGQSTIGTLAIGTAAGVGAVGKVWYKDITPFVANPGTQIVTDVTTAATTSGKAIMSFEGDDNPYKVTDFSNVAVSVA